MAETLASDADILTAIETFRQRHGIPVTTFGRRSVGDANLIANLKDGRELRRATLARINQFMSEYSSEQAAA
ncbi:MAG TPA: hypothetical protein H9899_12020 [Candidatus Sphingomonas excrementigallinarum]|nr:hypothetical protein [Candidatus Sphingomonas excrementigallinarum]